MQPDKRLRIYPAWRRPQSAGSACVRHVPLPKRPAEYRPQGIFSSGQHRHRLALHRRLDYPSTDPQNGANEHAGRRLGKRDRRLPGTAAHRAVRTKDHFRTARHAGERIGNRRILSGQQKQLHPGQRHPLLVLPLGYLLRRGTAKKAPYGLCPGQGALRLGQEPQKPRRPCRGAGKPVWKTS